MFEHSVRVPRHYKVAANIFKKVSTEGGSVKTLLYDNKLRHFRTNVLFALITETVKHAADIDKIFEASEILKNESRLDPWLAKVLTAELLFGKKALPGISKPEQTILAYKEKFQKYTNEHEAELKTEVVHRPRYVRVNTILLTTSDAIRSFQDEGYKFIRCTSGSYNDYLEQIKGLGEYDFTQDYHVKTVFVFPPGTKLHEHELYMENQIILQDKATAMAVHLLAPSPGSIVLDMCAAPGMKTTQVAAYMRNEGKVIAVERNENRFQTLTDFVNKTGCKCVELIHKDILEIRRGDHDDVEYILLDPSCSGSGMEFTVHNYIEDTRLAKLTSLQEKFLKHAMNAFPKAKRIVYSTCSLFPEENERVITNVVKNSRVKWRVQDVKEMLKGEWNNFGSGMYGSMGTRCLYAKPDSDLTIGFFLAVLDRDLTDLEKHINGEDQIASDEINVNKITNEDILVTQMRKKNIECIKNNVSQAEDDIENLNRKMKEKKEKDFSDNNVHTTTGIRVNKEGGDDAKKKLKSKPVQLEPQLEVLINDAVDAVRKKKNEKRKDNVEPLSAEINNDNIVQGEESVTVKKKKRKHSAGPESTEINNDNIAQVEESVTCKKKKKQKKRKHSVESESTEVNNDIAQDEASVRVKKKKLKRSLEPEYTEINNDTSVGEKSVKGKKKKQKCEDSIDKQFISAEINGEAIVNGEPKSKKKKKKKDKYHDHNNMSSENFEENNINVLNFEDGKTNIAHGIKKKRKKHDDNNIN